MCTKYPLHFAACPRFLAALLCRYHDVYRRYNYTTPKSYLELISLYKQLLASKREQLRQAKQRLESGVDKITLVGGTSLAVC